MAKGDVVLVPVVLTAHSPEELAKLVTAERLKKEQIAAPAHYTSTYVLRNINPSSGSVSGYVKYVAFVEFLVPEE